MANVAIPANIESQQKTLETFVRSKTKSWIGQVLKTDDDFRDISLEELFANGWILGRIADTCNAILLDKPYTFNSPNQHHDSNRPYNATINDIEQFHALCHALLIPLDSRITLADVEQRRAGVRIALCIWDISDAMRSKGFKTQIPDFAPKEEHALLRQCIPTESHKSMVEHFEHTSGTSPVKIPHNPSHLVSSNTSSSTSTPLRHPPTQPPPPPPPAAAASTSMTSTRTTPMTFNTAMTLQQHHASDTPIDQMIALTLQASKDPISLHGWLRNDTAVSSPVQLPRNTGDIHDGMPGKKTSKGTDKDKNIEEWHTAPEESTGLDVLQSILTPDAAKPKHTQLMNAILRSDSLTIHQEDDTEDGLGNGPGIQQHAKRSLTLETGRASTRHTSQMRDSTRYVKVIGTSLSSSKRATTREDGLKIPGAMSVVAVSVVAAAVAVVIKAMTRSSYEKSLSSRNDTHQGRW